jgi:hypothetical protein
LKELLVSSNNIKSFKSLQGGSTLFKGIQEIHASSNPLKSLGSFPKNISKGLVSLRLCDCLISGIEGIHVDFPKLKDLHLRGNKIKSFKGISRVFPHLEVLDLRQNLLESHKDLTLLKNLTDLCVLKLSGNPLCSIGNKYKVEGLEILPHIHLLDDMEQSLPLLQKEKEDGSTSFLIDDMGLDLTLGLDDLEKQFHKKHKLGQSDRPHLPMAPTKSQQAQQLIFDVIQKKRYIY